MPRCFLRMLRGIAPRPLTLGLILTIVSHALALRQRPLLPRARLLRWSLLAVGIVALVMGVEPLWVGLG
jgi:hypothetical protein